MEFAITLALVGLAAVILIMCAAVIFLAWTTHGQFKPKHFKNNGPMHRIYTGINTDVVVVTFNSSNNKFAICDCLYWVVKLGVDKFFAIDRIIYLDLDTKALYRPNHGKFDMTTALHVDYTDKDDGAITGLEIYDDHRQIDYKFEYKEII